MTSCPSSHGGGGYACGSRWDGDAIVCGICGYRIENPPRTGGRLMRRLKQNRHWWERFLRLTREDYWEPTWPGWIA